jgi:hypothetical protein
VSDEGRLAIRNDFRCSWLGPRRWYSWYHDNGKCRIPMEALKNVILKQKMGIPTISKFALTTIPNTHDVCDLFNCSVRYEPCHTLGICTSSKEHRIGVSRHYKATASSIVISPLHNPTGAQLSLKTAFLHHFKSIQQKRDIVPRLVYSHILLFTRHSLKRASVLCLV